MAATDSALVLVTGVTGYIATHVVQQLLETGQYRVRGTVRSKSKAQYIREIFPDLELCEADLTDNKGWNE